MNEPRPAPPFARRMLGAILIPTVIFIGITRFTSSYWLDMLSIALAILVASLAFMSRGATVDATSIQEKSQAERESESPRKDSP